MYKHKTSYLRRHRMLRDNQPWQGDVQASVPIEQALVSAMYAHLLTSWDELPDHTRLALGSDLVAGSDGEEAALNRFAKIFLDYADVSFQHALAARRRRVGIEQSDEQHTG